MRVNGRDIAENLYHNLREQVNSLKQKGITPHLVVILVGEDPASVAYVGQKKKHGEAIGMKVTVLHFPNDTTEQKLLITIEQCNNDNNVHGIIIQQPLPRHIDAQTLVHLTHPAKDVDGFHPQSKFTPPIAEAAIEILRSIFAVIASEAKQSSASEIATYPAKPDSRNDANFLFWLKSKTIVVIGKGETGGTPIKNKFEQLGNHVTVIDSKTENPDEITKNADIIVSCVGKPNILTKDKLKKEVILLSVGMYREEDGKLHGDYEPEEVDDIASFYTPVPGGVGPVNVAMLLINVIIATKLLLKVQEVS